MNYSERRPRGARPGRPDTRQQVLDIARRRFRAEGYRAVTLRSIADEADVDVALLSYYFGSKRGLFAASLDLRSNPPELLRAELRGNPETLAERILRTMIATWDDPERGAGLATMIRTAIQEPEFGKLVREVIEREIVETLVDYLGGVHARRKAAAMSTQLLGLVVARYIVGLEPVASMSADELVRTLTPGLRAALAAPTPRKRVPLINPS